MKVKPNYIGKEMLTLGAFTGWVRNSIMFELMKIWNQSRWPVILVKI